MSADEVAKAFAQHYYQMADSNVAGLSGLYKDASMLTFEGTQIVGSTNIVAKLQSFGKVAHTVTQMDVQPSATQNAIIVFVCGNISIDGGNPMMFTQMFQLVASSPGQYYVHNDIFRLNFQC
jgi:hypothetical protein